MKNRVELIEQGYVSVGFVGEHEWFTKFTLDDECLYYVVKNGVAIHQYPKVITKDTIEGIMLIKQRWMK
jgi:hypothetical protein